MDESCKEENSARLTEDENSVQAANKGRCYPDEMITSGRNLCRETAHLTDGN
jgi:hypothetical protein